jgi:hypothetical protein
MNVEGIYLRVAPYIQQVMAFLEDLNIIVAKDVPKEQAMKRLTSLVFKIYALGYEN